MNVLAIVRYGGLIDTSEAYRYIRMFGQKMGYGISATQMQYNADN